LQRLAALSPRALAVMHGSAFRGGCGKAIADLAAVINQLLGAPGRAC